MMKFKEWWSTREDFYDHSDEVSIYSAARDGWEARQAEINELYERIDLLEDIRKAQANMIYKLDPRISREMRMRKPK
jgi:hypothetical protein